MAASGRNSLVQKWALVSGEPKPSAVTPRGARTSQAARVQKERASPSPTRRAGRPWERVPSTGEGAARTAGRPSWTRRTASPPYDSDEREIAGGEPPGTTQGRAPRDVRADPFATGDRTGGPVRKRERLAPAVPPTERPAERPPQPQSKGGEAPTVSWEHWVALSQRQPLAGSGMPH